MPRISPHYMLEAFLDGDIYSAIADSRRFRTVDNQLNTVSEIIGDGRIDGWDIEANDFPFVTVTKGSGLIDRFYVRIFEDQIKELETEGTFYFFAQRRVGVIGAQGPRSDLVSITYVDEGPPETPVLTLDSPDGFLVILTWTANIEDDFSHYEIERSTDGAFELLDSVTETRFEDVTVDENTSYSYRLSAVDLSGNKGSATGTIATGISSQLPPDPMEVGISSAEFGANVLWKFPPTISIDDVQHYMITVTQLNTDNSPRNATTSMTIVSKNLLNERVDDLTNGEKYKIILQLVDTLNRSSSGISKTVIPRQIPGPPDPIALAYSETPGPGGIIVSLSWTEGDNPYDPAETFRFKIYGQVDGQPETKGIDVPIGLTEEEISLLTFDFINYFTIPEDTLVTFRITALTEDNHESQGNYIRFKTSKFSTPRPVVDLQSTFDPLNSSITVTWSVRPDTDTIRIAITDTVIGVDDTTTIVDTDLGKASRFFFDDVNVGHRYEFSIYACSSAGICSNPSTTRQTILQENTLDGLPLPALPTDVLAKAGDRQITLEWEASINTSVESYNIYRKEGGISFNFTSWSLLDTLDKDQTSFTDYGLENEQRYSYYITAVDIYDRESLHLPDDFVNLNFIRATPGIQGKLFEPTNLAVSLIDGNQIQLAWFTTLEEFDAFTIYRSNNNLHSWEEIGTIQRRDDAGPYVFTDTTLPLIDGTTFFYTVDKIIDDAEIIVQTSSDSPQNAICIGQVTTTTGVSEIDQTCRRDIKDLEAPLTEITSNFLLSHRHREIEVLDPTRIDLNPELVITDWTTVDGRIFTTSESDIEGTLHIVTINDRFPNIFFDVDVDNQRLIFAEPIVSINDQGVITESLPAIRMRVIGVEEVQGVIDNFRIGNLHARQVQFGTLNREQLPQLDHQGRVFEKLLPDSYLLERFNNHQFIVPENSTDATKTFGTGTAFFSVQDSDGAVEEIVNFESQDDGAVVVFQKPSFSETTVLNLKQNPVVEDTMNDLANHYRFKEEKQWGISNDNQVYVFEWGDTPTVETAIGSISVNFTVRGLTFDSTRNKAFIAAKDAARTFDAIYEMDLRTLEMTFILEISPAATSPQLTQIQDITTFRSGTSTFIYAACTNTNGFGQLIRVDIDSGIVTDIGELKDFGTSRLITAITTFDDNSTPIVMYGAAADVADNIYTIEPSTAVLTSIGTIFEGNDLTAMSWDYRASAGETDGQPYALSDDSPTSLVKIGVMTSPGRRTSIKSETNADSALESPPQDLSFYFTDPSAVTIGSYQGFQSDTYLRFRVNVPNNTTLGSATLKLTAHSTDPSSGDNVILEVSMIDPDVSTAVDLPAESITSAETQNAFRWAPTAWTANLTIELDITNVVRAFVERDGYESGQLIIIKIQTLTATTGGHFRAAFATGDTTSPRLISTYVLDVAEVNSDPGGFQSNKSYHFRFEFEDDSPTRWVRISTEDTDRKPNPIIKLGKRLRFHILLTEGSLYLTLGVREIGDMGVVGEDGGTDGPIEWVGITDTIVTGSQTVPIGLLINPSNNWQDIDIDLRRSGLKSFSGGNNELDGDFGVLEHLAFTVDPNSQNPTGPFNVYIDKLQQIDDLLVAGTSQGIQVSDDFGTTWQLSRLTNTPVHKFMKSDRNNLLWAIASNEVFLTADPLFWFPTTGLIGVHSIRDITEDNTGNVYISTNKGVYFLDINLVRKFTSWNQTSPVTPLSLDTYALYHDSDNDEIWVSTESGIFKTDDEGETWTDTGLSTNGLVAYKISDINSDPNNPNLIATTRKHVLRKLSTDSNFAVIANFEEQHSITDIWTFVFFGERIYVSTGKGVYRSTLGQLSTPGSLTITFDRTMTDLDFNGNTGIAFDMNPIPIGANQQIFICQENRLMVSDEDGTLSLRSEFFGTLPSFFSNNNEIIIGYTYNAFNNVVSFREPRAVNETIKACFLPRNKYVAVNKGWAQTNPLTDIFIFQDGVPKWIHFAYDQTQTDLSLSSLQDKLASISELTDFNSLHPTASERLTTVNNDIAAVRSEATRETIVTLFDDYTRFLSLINQSIIDDLELELPQVSMSGRDSSPAGSRAAILEEKEGITFDSSDGIRVDTVSGTIDFTLNPGQFEFDKYDKFHITVFNTHIGDIGGFTHRDLEDQMESRNTGLPSQLSRVHYGNMIKSGIFLESQHNFLFDRYNVSNIQSRYYSTHFADWYDSVNSTVDYETTIEIDNESSVRFVNAIYLFTEDPYFSVKIWVATDVGIVQLDITENGEISVEDFIKPNADYPFVRDIYAISDQEVYTVISNEHSESKIYLTTDFGGTWVEIDNTNLPDTIFNFRILSGNGIAGTSEGVFFSDNNFEGWFQPNLIVSDRITDTALAEQTFRKPVFNLHQGKFIIGAAEDLFFMSSQGAEFFTPGSINGEVSVINDIVRFKNMTWVATDRGLYNDANSILSDNVAFGLENLETENADRIQINNIVHGINAVYVASSEGKIYRLLNTNDENLNFLNQWMQFKVPDFGSIHKMLLYESTSHWLILFSYNKVKVINVTTSSDANETRDGIFRVAEES